MSPSRPLVSSSASSSCLFLDKTSSSGLLIGSEASTLGLSPSSTSALNGLPARAFSIGAPLDSVTGGGVATGVGTPFESDAPFCDLIAYIGLGAGEGAG